MKKLSAVLFSSLLGLSVMASSAEAGNSRHYNGTGFILFDLFGQAPQSKYRRSNTKVYGYNRKVGSYSYKYEDVIDYNLYRPYRYNPINDRNPFDTRLGVDGVYVGD
ncbi:MAG: hypothetical protein DHS20C08_07400 [Rhodomicrobium sp.]|nr:MAG: hypothetical protein DHS20C08_07400 [Rhodomicrobium sp.]